jgi:hypothetical protein
MEVQRRKKKNTSNCHLGFSAGGGELSIEKERTSR